MHVVKHFFLNFRDQYVWMQDIVRCILVRRPIKRVYTYAVYYGTDINTTFIKKLGSFEMCCWRRMEKIKWSEKVMNKFLTV